VGKEKEVEGQRRKTDLSLVLQERNRQPERAAGAWRLIQLMLWLTREFTAGGRAVKS